MLELKFTGGDGSLLLGSVQRTDRKSVWSLQGQRLSYN
jgi:hypothetical protein